VSCFTLKSDRQTKILGWGDARGAWWHKVNAVMTRLGMMLAAAIAIVVAAVGGTVHTKMAMQTFPVLAGAGAHDVYPAPDGTVWFTAQSAGKLGRLDPRTGRSDLIALGPGAAPHGVTVGPDGAAWVTEGGQNAIARVDPATRAVKALPATQGAKQRQPQHRSS
jgi:virginiamycin B lyase